MWLVVANFLVSENLFFSSGHDQVTMFLWISSKRMLFSVFTRKGRIPKHSFHPLRSWFWLRESRFQLAACTGQGPQTFPSSHHWGSQCPTYWPSGFSGPPNGGGMGGGSHEDCDPGRLTLLLGRRDRDVWGGGAGEFTAASRPGPSQRAALVRALEPCKTQPPSLFSGPPAHRCPKAGWVGRPQGEGWDPLLTSLSTWWPPLHLLLAESLTDESSLTVSHLWTGPTAARTKG